MDVVLSVSADGWNRWGERFVKRQPLSRTQLLIANGVSAEVAKKAILRAIAVAGAGGRVIINVGHGTGGGNLDATEGTFDLAPSRALRIGGKLVKNTFVDVFYDVRARPDQPSDMESDLKDNPKSERLAHWRVYQEIATAFKTVRPRELVLLTCNVGNATEFLRKAANDWGVIITAYRKRVSLTEDIVTVGRAVKHHFYLHLENDSPLHKNAADLVIHEEELPFRPADTFRVGPPLP